ncbi:hypothetical protein Dimus_016164 [Dionaea muscipula]
MSVIHLKKKDVVKSKVRGVEMEFDHEKLATILGVPGTNEICEYRKDVWEESKYTKPLEIIRRFANDENLMAARRVKEQGVWWLGSGANRRRYEIETEAVNEEEILAENVEVKNQKENFKLESVNEEVELQGEQIEKEAKGVDIESVEEFFDAVEEERTTSEDVSAPAARENVQQKGKTKTTGVYPSGSLPDFDLQHLQAEFARALQANSRFQELY